MNCYWIFKKTRAADLFAAMAQNTLVDGTACNDFDSSIVELY